MRGGVAPALPSLAELGVLANRSALAILMFRLATQSLLVANDAATELIGRPESAILGRPPADMWAGPGGGRCQVALSALAVGAVDSYAAHAQLRRGGGGSALAVSISVRRVPAVGGPVAVMVIVPVPEPAAAIHTLEAFLGPEAARWAGDITSGAGEERIAAVERHLARLAAELHASQWRGAHPLAVDSSHFGALDRLPKRQREIVDRLLRGERIPAIGSSMYISASTVRNHLSHVYQAFHVHSQGALLAILRSGPEQDDQG